MYGWDSLVLLQHFFDDGLSKTAIAQRLGVSRRVIYHWLATGQLTRDVEVPVPRRASPRATQLDPYTGIIAARLETYPEPSAVRLFDGEEFDHCDERRGRLLVARKRHTDSMNIA